MNWTRNHRLLLVIAILMGALLRIHLFPAIPPGLNQDEAAAAYDAYSLGLTGADKWGNFLPAYLAAWGPGTSALYSWLSVPFIITFGLNVFTTRIVNVIIGILTLPLLYFTTKQVFDRHIALISTFLLAILPWHIMASRWGLECNILPFFVLLGIYPLTKALEKNPSPLWIVFAFVPWALSMYTYVTAFFVIPFFILLILWTYRTQVWKHRWLWFTALAIYGVLTLPVALVFVKNFILHSELGIEPFLPFSLPWLSHNRYNDVAIGFPKTQYFNLIFLLNGFDDQQIFNSTLLLSPFSVILFPFLWLGIYALARRNNNIPASNNLFLLWLAACVPFILAVQLNINRGNILLIPVGVVSVIGFRELLRNLTLDMRKAMVWIAWITIVMNSLAFNIYYFRYYSDKAASSFQTGLGDALKAAERVAFPQQKIYISPLIPLTYVYALFYFQFPPEQFQEISATQLNPVQNRYGVSQFDRFYFNLDLLFSQTAPNESFIYVTHTFEGDACLSPKEIHTDEAWKVGICK